MLGALKRCTKKRHLCGSKSSSMLVQTVNDDYLMITVRTGFRIVLPGHV